MATPPPGSRGVAGNQFRDGTTINQGDVHNHLHLPLQPAPSVILTIPYPRNDEVIHRSDLVDKLNALLPPGQKHQAVALWGLGGSGKTQIVLDYAYKRHAAGDCSVFWVHADSEATFTHDYKSLASKLGVDKSLEGEQLFQAVREAVETQARWVFIVDNADDLSFFGVGQTSGQIQDFSKYLPQDSTGTIIWTSRDALVAEIVGPRRAVEVAQMTPDEARQLLATARNDEPEVEAGPAYQESTALLEELHGLPLAIAQAGAYMRRTSTSTKDYLSMLLQERQRWKVLQRSQFDRYRRPGVPNSVLETWRISIDRIGCESLLAYRILHVIAYVDNQNIPHDLIVAASGASACQNDKSVADDEEPDLLDVQDAVIRLKDFSFISVRHTETGERSYDMHKLVQEATRYSLSMVNMLAKGDSANDSYEGLLENTQGYFSAAALEAVARLFPESEPETWTECEKYLAHAVQVGSWAEMCDKEVETAELLGAVSIFLHDRGRWREKEPLNQRALELRRRILGERHPDTIESIASLATIYHTQGRYHEAEDIYIKVLDLRRDILGDRHLDTIESMASLAMTYHTQGRYHESEDIYIKVLDLRRDILGDRHPDTIESMASLAMTYHTQGRYHEAEDIYIKVLDLRRDILGDRHLDTIESMASLAMTYHTQGRYHESEDIYIKVLDLRRDILGDRHPDTIESMANLGATYYTQGRHSEAEEIGVKVLDLQRDILGERHPGTIQSMANLGATYHEQGRYDESEEIKVKALDLERDILGERHPDTMQNMANLGATYHMQGRYSEAEEIGVKVLDLQRDILGERHPGTIQSMGNLAITWYSLSRYDQALPLMQACLDGQRSVLGSNHPETRRTAELLQQWSF